MKQLFISYSHRNKDEVDIIEDALNARGLVTWRDTESLNLGVMQSSIRKLLSNPDEIGGYVLLVTPDSWRSSPVKDWELPEAIERFKRDKSFPIILFVRDIGLDQIKEESYLQYGVDLTNHLAFLLPPSWKDEDIRPPIHSAGKKVLEWRLNQLRRQIETIERIVIDLHTRENTKFEIESHFKIRLDQRIYLQAKTEPKVWEETILPGMQDLKKAVAERVGDRAEIFVQSKANISAAMALGYIFRATSGFKMTMKQGDTYWTTSNEGDGDFFLVEDDGFDGFSSSKDIFLEIGVSNNTSQAVEQFIRDSKMKYRYRDIWINPHTSIPITYTQAVQIAHQIRRRLNDYSQRFGSDIVVHLFYAGPLALAMMIGHQLNARGRVQIYDCTIDNTSYYPTALLGTL